ncbi:hypothetical protein PAAG_00910 [Paracoccidioides lutzii Pb01]|uniref:Transcription factor domain-containing protein n=1 Tax=Paracoccidioides lutzii (strain ATCC MYA-826 / Pb01) TaxID=502779 RepID=C1GQW5_PARBA|nr:hypothetical protein PAAG_00910 [Paracoccidioides lutzii Pb01]EEH37989.2 hypothetical protein PAAG_00910 [Paracoccidioides lutzii Pb01]
MIQYTLHGEILLELKHHAHRSSQHLTQNLQYPIAFQEAQVHPSLSLLTGLEAPPTSACQPSEEMELLKAKVRQFQEQLSQVTEKTSGFPSLTSMSTANIETTSSSLAGTLSVHCDSSMVGEARAISGSVFRKNHLFGQSLWINGAEQFLRDVLDFVEPHIQHSCEESSSMKRCKRLAKVIADILVACYLRTTETVYRILHVPTFRKDYEAVWAAGLTPDTASLVQLKLVLAIGAATYDNFDTEPPGNFNDDQLMVGDAVPAPEDTFALRATFPIRLMITEFLNNFGSCGTYEETLRLGESLRAVVYNELCQNLQRHISRAGLSPSRFQTQVVDFIMIHYMSALHVPFFIPALHETTYTLSRKVVIETSLKIWRAVWPSSRLIPTLPHDNATLRLDEDDLVRLTISGSEFFGAATMQAGLMAATELMSQLQGASGLSPAPLRSDLLAAINMVFKVH